MSSAQIGHLRSSRFLHTTANKNANNGEIKSESRNHPPPERPRLFDAKTPTRMAKKTQKNSNIMALLLVLCIAHLRRLTLPPCPRGGRRSWLGLRLQLRRGSRTSRTENGCPRSGRTTRPRRPPWLLGTISCGTSSVVL